MLIYVDADACAVKKETVQVARKYNIEVIMVSSICHISKEDGYSRYLIVDNGDQSVDMTIINRVNKNDLVVTDDYGLASMALMKKAFCISSRGLIFNLENIDRLMLQRYIGQQIRKGGGRTKGPSKHKSEDDLHFIQGLDKLIREAQYNPTE
ncbi:MAG: hypothetical protein K0R93_3070 [Anaerosolibacter sp.]|jgi:uncharacterized protein YaiI (UPF0178 family)|uniref:YaiI/YqxD family protein n=1 Tax=Anaerosolibacter sp. TaxID=1872527 RepID=UPI0026043C73|nr:YaiI/YqxD family protein [Anaerosolibacter sp.]MDF2548172.1 hypothetical protein [Anaerosolibacter sp.]